jgi:hypothetical protein
MIMNLNNVINTRHNPIIANTKYSFQHAMIKIAVMPVGKSNLLKSMCNILNPEIIMIASNIVLFFND